MNSKMKKGSALLLLLLFLIAGWLIFKDVLSPALTPEATIRRFVELYRVNDFKAAEPYLAPISVEMTLPGNALGKKIREKITIIDISTENLLKKSEADVTLETLDIRQVLSRAILLAALDTSEQPEEEKLDSIFEQILAGDINQLPITIEHIAFPMVQDGKVWKINLTSALQNALDGDLQHKLDAMYK